MCIESQDMCLDLEPVLPSALCLCANYCNILALLPIFQNVLYIFVPIFVNIHSGAAGGVQGKRKL